MGEESEFYNRSMKLWLQDNGVEMYSTFIFKISYFLESYDHSKNKKRS